MRVRTAQLSGAALDWAVAKCEEPHPGYFTGMVLRMQDRGEGVPYNPSTDWSQGGPIIEREKMDVYHSKDIWVASIWVGTPGGSRLMCRGSGYAPLIAAMRCYVASKLGDEVDIPDELCAG